MGKWSGAVRWGTFTLRAPLQFVFRFMETARGHRPGHDFVL